MSLFYSPGVYIDNFWLSFLHTVSTEICIYSKCWQEDWLITQDEHWLLSWPLFSFTGTSEQPVDHGMNFFEPEIYLQLPKKLSNNRIVFQFKRYRSRFRSNNGSLTCSQLCSCNDVCLYRCTLCRLQPKLEQTASWSPAQFLRNRKGPGRILCTAHTWNQ